MYSIFAIQICITNKKAALGLSGNKDHPRSDKTNYINPKIKNIQFLLNSTNRCTINASIRL